MGILSLVLLLIPLLNVLLLPILLLATVSFAILLALILLRLSTYFRDNYRATNFGVPDLVELLRQVDQAVFNALLVRHLEEGEVKAVLQATHTPIEEWQQADLDKRLDIWENFPVGEEKEKLFNHLSSRISKKLNGVKLSFIGHSMGCFVVTNTLRILSDVFDHRAIDGIPTKEIGRVYRLERLVLVAPDIPVETIMPRRANFLRSALLRCEESYVFCNEGDLALRLASTAANYFSFPAKTRSSGYRLGNVTAKRFDDKDDFNNRRIGDKEYGIVNLQDGDVDYPFNQLEIRASNQEHLLLQKLRDRDDLIQEKIPGARREAIVADLFTYFDCTDYRDQESENPSVELPPVPHAQSGRGIVTYALRKAALNLVDYITLSLAYFVKFPREINTHGGYFRGEFSQQVMYRIAFTGFSEFLTWFQAKGAEEEKDAEGKPTSTPYTVEERQAFLNQFSEYCRSRGIQVILAPSRYNRNVLGKE